MEDGNVVVMKRGIGNIEQFVLLKNGAEKKLFTPGFVNDAGMLSAAANQKLRGVSMDMIRDGG